MAKKLNQLEADKKIDDAIRKRLTYIIPDLNKIRISIPEKTHINQMLFHNYIFNKVNENGEYSESGKFGQVNIFYLAPSEYNNLIKLFKDFNAPEKAHANLIAAYLSMVIASCEAVYTNHFYQEHNRNMNELAKGFSFLEQLREGQIHLTGITFEYQQKSDKKGFPDGDIYGPSKIFKIKGDHAAKFLEGVLQNYDSAPNYSMLKKITDGHIQHAMSNQFWGHKNAEKHFQSYYSSALFNYLRHELFGNTFELLDDRQKFDAEVSKLRRLYPRNHIFLFIGKLMTLSGLLAIKPGNDDATITDAIGKKLRPQLQVERKKQQQIKEHNKNPVEGEIRFQPFDELF